jgi:hypothetical protein
MHTDKHFTGQTRQRKKTLSKILLLVTSICLSFLASEFILRHVRPLDTGKSYEFRIPHPIFGWSLQPGAAYRNYLPEEAVSVTYNSDGWRDVQHDREKRDGVFRILVLGDSFMEGYSVNLKDSFHKVAEGLMQNRGMNVEFINMGVGGYGTLQEYLVYREAGRRYVPDIVLLGFYVSNDVTNNSMKLESMLVSNTSEIHSRPFLDPDKLPEWKIVPVDFRGIQKRFDESQKNNYPLGRALSRRSALVWLISEESMRIVHKIPSFFDNSERVDAENEGISGEQIDFALSGVHYCDEPEEYTRAWNITKRILYRLKHDVENDGARLIVFTVPSVAEAREGNVNETGDSCIEAAPGYERLHRMLDGLGIDFIDLLPDFRKAVRERNIELFRRSDKHWNPAGHALAARVVVSALMEKNIFEKTVGKRKNQ